MHKVGVCIVNYRTAELVKECLQGLFAIKGEASELKVAVVDNDSGDGSFDALQQFVEQQGWEGWVDIVDGEKNGGFSYGNNLAIKTLESSSTPDFFWLVNPDTRPREGSLKALITLLDNTSEAGIAGSRLEDDDGTQQISAFNFPRPFGDFVNTLGLGVLRRTFPSYVVAQKLHSGEAESVDWVAGASMLIKREVVDAIGLMDEDYFLYFEEVDYCITAKRAGFKTFVVPESRVVHYVGASTGISDTRKKAKRRPTYWFESRKRFFFKNYGFLSLFFADVCWMVAYPLKRIKMALTRKECLDPPYFLRDFFMNSIFVRGANIGSREQ
ncbi:glycosyltransferase family 2 protein [Marinibactrum halimedae]|uniref:Rhamnosyltransferase n=1 Tax=Marinibactrum halimedae TaxID=1444977 RepID=A0AA37T3X0_9GAMM|nr:glycosyltransferase family 2 protein [Marinibactrum halimedae]MCD9459765.1 glycosyltransferase family 2 protein [Marinibactrum halimedae]GLS24478.1 rhamnosyltransferase [Marinibactrum halimedae]